MRPLRVAAVLVAFGCASPQPLVPDVRPARVTWKQDVAPLLATSCGRCHTGAAAAAGYRTDNYLAVIAQARAGDATSPLLVMLDPARADASHGGLAAAFATLTTWVVDGDLGYERSEVHGNGMMNPSAPDFHGQVARELGWDLGKCAQCHGADFGGGKAGASCLTCHPGGPTACTTCHGQPPATGAHLAHTAGPTLGRKLDCTECHIK